MKHKLPNNQKTQRDMCSHVSLFVAESPAGGVCLWELGVAGINAVPRRRAARVNVEPVSLRTA